MPRPDWERFRPPAVIGHHEYGYRSVGSTMDVAWELAEAGAAHGTCVVAGTQTHGRGRFDREWVSGDSLLASVVLRPSASTAPLLTIIGCLAVRDAVRELCGLRCAIKWPNDVQVDGRKLCGVLAEGRIYATGTTGAGVAVLGIGLNVSLDVAEHPELAATATSLLAETGRSIDLRTAGDALFASLDAWYGGAEPAALIARWREAIDTLGRRVSVRVRGSNATLSGLAEDVDAAGRLLLRTDDGVLHALDEGDVTLAG
ncbi:MAG: biotin--[acetyl-CoA-carboxylase] ligase [Chloroflexi bacterium]|nr:biotin--[acetyl-CoA-carboxylase] ligase [Chloroflexota bacterium]MCH7654542.1 biotin--[acetyl-CoA-carboxylase] ligase [Chloroflexota bacterium]